MDNFNPFGYENQENEGGSSLGREWIPDAAILALASERETLYPSETDIKASTRIFRESAPIVAKGLVHMALNAKNENTRLRASQLILERAMGRIMDAEVEAADTPMNQLFDDMDKFMQETANTDSSTVSTTAANTKEGE